LEVWDVASIWIVFSSPLFFILLKHKERIGLVAMVHGTLLYDKSQCTPNLNISFFFSNQKINHQIIFWIILMPI
jgi:hypothetical protein